MVGTEMPAASRIASGEAPGEAPRSDGAKKRASTGPMAAMPPVASAAHVTIWVSPIAPMPSTLPISSSNGRTDETMTSTTRLLFSSMTPCITYWP